MLYKQAMHGFATMFLVSALLGTAPAPVDGCASLNVELDLQLEASDARAADLAHDVMSALPLYDRVYATSGWIGVALNDDFAVLVDLRLGGEATSPDPARPDPRAAVAASLGISVRSWGGIEL